MSLKNFLGFGSDTDKSETHQVTAEEAVASVVTSNDTTTVRRIIAELGSLEPDQRRFWPALPTCCSRAAHADLEFTQEETALMEKTVIEIGKLPEAQAVLVVEIAKNQSDLYSGTEDFVVTREFAGRATLEQKLAVMESCFAVVASDHAITSTEFAELTRSPTSLASSRTELNVIRNKYKEDLTALQQMRAQTGSTDSGAIAST